MLVLNKYKLEDIEVGQVFEIQKDLSLDQIQQFAVLTDDHHPLHTSKEYAVNNGFKDIMAHGLLISSFSSALIGMKIPGENAIIISQAFKYRQPAFPGDVLTIKGTVKEKELRFNNIAVKIRITNQSNKLIATGEYVVKIRVVQGSKN